MNPSPALSPTLSDAERIMIERYARLPLDPLWQTLLPFVGLTILFGGLSVFFRWLPSRYDAVGIALCARHGPVWIPIGEGTSGLETLLKAASCALFLAGVFLG